MAPCSVLVLAVMFLLLATAQLCAGYGSSKVANKKKSASGTLKCEYKCLDHIKEMVQLYLVTKHWPSLMYELSKTLEKNTMEYRQLTEASSLRIIGENGYFQLAKLLLCAGLPALQADSNGDTMLHGAANGNCMEIVNMLLDQGVDVRVKNYINITPLLEAIYSHNLAIVDRLVEAGANATVRDYYDYSALNWARIADPRSVLPIKNVSEENALKCDYIHLEKVKKLVDAYVNITCWQRLMSRLRNVLDCTSEEHRQLQASSSPWFLGYTGNTQIAKLLLCAGLPVQVADTNGETMLHGAAFGGHLELVSMLLDQGADVNKRTGHNRTPVLWAVVGKHLDVAEHLVIAGANTTLRDMYNISAVDWAPLADFIEMKENEEDENRTLTCEQDDLEEIEKVVQSFVKDKHWDRLVSDLGAVLDHDSEEYVQLQGSPSPWFIGYKGHAQLAKLLLCAGLPVQVADGKGDTMLHGAAFGGHLRVVNILLGRGADANVRNALDRTPLMWAAVGKKLAVARRLVKAGANTTLRDTYNRSAADWGPLGDLTAAMANRNISENRRTLKCDKQQHSKEIKKVVQLYIEEKHWPRLIARLEAVLEKNSEEYGQLHDASSQWLLGYNGHMQLAKLLLCAGLPVQTTDANGETMLHGSAYGGHLHLVNMLLEQGADVDARNSYDRTPLIWAALGHNLAVVQRLVKAGANTTVRDTYDPSALDWVRLANNPAKVENISFPERSLKCDQEYLKEVKKVVQSYNLDRLWPRLITDLKAVLGSNSEEYSQLQSSTSPWFIGYKGHTELARLLLCGGLPVQVEDSNGETMLHGAAYGDHMHLVNILLDQEADIDAKNHYNRTPLIWAAVGNNLAMVQHLAKAGANTTVTDMYGLSAFN